MTALELIKTSYGQRRETIHLVMKDDAAKRVLVAWTCYRPAFADFVVSPKDDPKTVRERLWDENSAIDYEVLGGIADLPQTRAQNIFLRLVAADLVYPDGTISDHAMTLLRAEAGAHLAALVPQRRLNAYTRGAGIPELQSDRVSSGGAPASGTNSQRLHTDDLDHRAPIGSGRKTRKRKS